MPWMVSANEGSVGLIFPIRNVAQQTRHLADKRAFKGITHCNLKARVFYAKIAPLAAWNLKVSAEWLKHQDFPKAGKHLTPASLSVPDIALFMQIITTAMRHDLMVAAHHPLHPPPKEASKVFVVSWRVFSYCWPPGGNEVVVRKCARTIEGSFELFVPMWIDPLSARIAFQAPPLPLHERNASKHVIHGFLVVTQSLLLSPSNQ